jgi:hypothetical protein
MAVVDIRLGLRALMLQNVDIAAAVGSNPVRIFPIVLPQGVTADSIVFTKITELETLTMEKSSGLVSARYQIDSVSESADRAASLANLVREQIAGYRGRIDLGLNSPVDHVNIQVIEVANARDDYDAVSFLYRASRDYFVWYEALNA